MEEQVHTTGDDVQAVLAYRVGQLEKTAAVGLAAVNDKLDNLAHNFATKAELEHEKKIANKEHEDIREDIKSLSESLNIIKLWKDSLITKIASGAVVMLVLMILAQYGLDKFL